MTVCVATVGAVVGLRTWQSEFDAAVAAWESSKSNETLAKIAYPGGLAQAQCQQASPPIPTVLP